MAFAIYRLSVAIVRGLELVFIWLYNPSRLKEGVHSDHTGRVIAYVATTFAILSNLSFVSLFNACKEGEYTRLLATRIISGSVQVVG